MDARNRKWIGIISSVLVAGLVLTGCQAKEPEREIVYEIEIPCPVEDFVETTVDPIQDPELGTVYRAYTQAFKLTCSEPYIEGRVHALLDGYIKSDSTSGWWGYYELVTDEGGVWKGICETTYPTSTVCTLLEGEGIYKGLQMSLESKFASSKVSIVVYRLPEVEE